MSEHSNREEMELAAKACGVQLHWKEGSCKGGPYESAFIERGGELVPWRPREDDGDALRLAVALHLEIDHNHPLDNDEWVMAIENGKMAGPSEEVDGNRDAATRSVIFRAAVALGKCLP